ncbi:aminotransferase [Nostoc sp. KVJ3]|uniref:phytanoyl-CoA dioxygenase family protein n=1 Tax=Nostoc sp. KVJ3 TaxID=457945 RepID=UPI0022382AA6|nr:phytanoyl-CoA dioxygenase family protein [Nostoc sp. KVJ3]MCW5313876.1 aminotransferase [Nostoc sp. KVJ3]
MSQTFLPNETQHIKNYYEENGYVIVKNVTSENKITDFINRYEAFKISKNYYFRSQDTNRPEKLSINEQGFIERSILNPLDLVFQKDFCQSASNIICSNSVSQLLKTLTDKQKHTVWQTMFFDKSTGTVAHQDHYYLDSDPAGHLVACWYALEDIQEDAGAFFVIPKTHKGTVVSRKTDVPLFSDHEEYAQNIQKLVREQSSQAQPLLLEKGSVLFWHPFLIHGAFQNVNPNHSRKSFTAHFLPEGYSRLGISKIKPTVASINPDITFWKKNLLHHAEASVRYWRYWLQVNLRPKSQRPYLEMRSAKYSELK